MDIDYSILPGGKDFDLTHKLEELTTKLHNMKKLKYALKVCNKSIALAPYNSVELFAALAKKTSILYDMERKDECVRNIDFIIQHPKCPVWITTELIDRKMKCIAITNPADTACPKNKLPVGHVSYKCRNISNFENPTDEVEPQIDGITVVVNKEYGRHVIATEDLKPGIVIVKEKSLFSSLYMDEVFEHCSNCLIRSGVLIPCRKCSKAMFCSDHCLCDANNRYHTIECALMDYFSSLDSTNSHIPLIIRMLSILSKQGTYLEKLKHQWEELKMKEFYYPKHTNELIIPENQITLIYYLETYSFTEEEHLCSIFKFQKLVEYMKEHTKFFSHIQNYQCKKIENFVVSLLVELEARCRCNIYAVTEKMFNNTKKYNNLFFLDKYINQKTVGFSFCKVLGFFNHSCIPNAAYTFQDGNHIVVCSLRSIKSGEQVSLCYTGYKGLYTKITKEERQNELKKYFNFICKCPACFYNWPRMEELKPLKQVMKRKYKVECCCCNIEEQIYRIIKNINNLSSEIEYKHVCDKIGEEIVRCIQLFEELSIDHLYLVREYVQLFQLFYVYIDAFGNSYPDYI